MKVSPVIPLCLVARFFSVLILKIVSSCKFESSQLPSLNSVQCPVTNIFNRLVSTCLNSPAVEFYLLIVPFVPGAAFKGIGPCEVSSGVGTQLAWLWKSCFGIDVYLGFCIELGSNPGKLCKARKKGFEEGCS